MKVVYVANDDNTGSVRLYVNGKETGQGTVDRIHRGTFSISETFDVGEDTGTPVSKSYTREYAFSGKLEKVVVALQ